MRGSAWAGIRHGAPTREKVLARLPAKLAEYGGLARHGEPWDARQQGSLEVVEKSLVMKSFPGTTVAPPLSPGHRAMREAARYTGTDCCRPLASLPDPALTWDLTHRRFAQGV